MITLWILENLRIEMDEPGTIWYIAAFEFILLEVPAIAVVVGWIRWILR